jgi:hypothetical protein
MPSVSRKSQTRNTFPPLDPDEFITVLRLGERAVHDRPVPPDTILKLEVRPGMVQDLTFNDVPINRFLMAIRDYFWDQGREADYDSFGARHWALLRMLDHPRCIPYRRRGEDSQVEIDEAVVRVAATAPLTKRFTFNAKDYFARVAAVVATRAAAEGSVH